MTDTQLIALGRAVAESTFHVDPDTWAVTVSCGPPERRIHSTTAGSLYSAIYEAAEITP